MKCPNCKIENLYVQDVRGRVTCGSCGYDSDIEKREKIRLVEKKSWMPYFEDIMYHRKKFDVRLGNFDINIGESILFREFNTLSNTYTGRECLRKVAFILKMKIDGTVKFGEFEYQFWSKALILEHGLIILGVE